MTEKLALSIPDFCEAHSFSRSGYYNLPHDQRPREMRVGKRVLITQEAAAEWRAAMEAQTAAELATAKDHDDDILDSDEEDEEAAGAI